MTRKILLYAFAALLACTTAVAQTFPTKPLRLVIPFPPGGSNDVVGRMIAFQLSERLGKSVVVDNQGGAGGIIGTEAVARAAPDGYTLGVSSLTTLVINPASMDHEHWPLDPFKDFTQIALLGGPPTVLIVDTRLAATTLQDFVALAKSQL